MAGTTVPCRGGCGSTSREGWRRKRLERERWIARRTETEGERGRTSRGWREERGARRSEERGRGMDGCKSGEISKPGWELSSSGQHHGWRVELECLPTPYTGTEPHRNSPTIMPSLPLFSRRVGWWGWQERTGYTPRVVEDGGEERGKGEGIALRHRTPDGAGRSCSRSLEWLVRASRHYFPGFRGVRVVCAEYAVEAVIDSSRRRRGISHGAPAGRALTRASQFRTVLCVNITCWFKCKWDLLVGNQMVVLEEGGMLTTGHNQYLPPDYLSPLPTTVSIFMLEL